MTKLFGTDGIRGTGNSWPLDSMTVAKIGVVLVNWVRAKTDGKKEVNILIGRDTRESGSRIESALTAGIGSKGGEVHTVGIMPTPGIAYLTRTNRQIDLGIVISASHNPAEDNGIKIFNCNGLKLREHEEIEIEQEVQKIEITDKVTGRAYELFDILRNKYKEHLLTVGRSADGLKHWNPKNYPLQEMKIVIDCANGAASKIGPELLEELGANVIALNTETDGKNINNSCGALHPEAIKKIVIEKKADIGITLDGDADRIILLDETGKVIDGDEILALCGAWYDGLDKLQGNAVVSTVMSNIGLKIFLNEREIELKQTKVGDKYVLEEMLLGDYVLGGEQSGHIIFREHSTTGDGLITALQILKIMVITRKKISDLITMKKAPQILINIPVVAKKNMEQMPKTTKLIKETEQTLGTKGRVLVRYSGTENKARVLVEGVAEKQVREIAEKIADAIKEEAK